MKIHPDWSTQTEAYNADIAVLILEQVVTFTQHIQPICLVISGIKIAKINDGLVVGYGKSEDESKNHENIPKVLETPIHSNSRCLGKYESLQRLSSGRRFCGGTGNGIGVCNGDSGSGLYVNDGQVYYLRGIVSSSLFNQNRGCDVNSYSVFTDVVKYVDWIDGLATSRFD
ncbi:serine protease gd-like [Chironomus tepperi]|uniref:serine protease gd-like n=1 Tax=Chironomus tepperi TaxID=113505 RepID=UPI00391F43FB